MNLRVVDVYSVDWQDSGAEINARTLIIAGEVMENLCNCLQLFDGIFVPLQPCRKYFQPCYIYVCV